MLNSLMYYILKCPIPTTSKGENFMNIKNYGFDVGTIWSFTDGKPLDDDEEPGELPIHIGVDYFHNYKGKPRELYDLGVCIISPRVKIVFDALGIDNILYFPAVLHISPLNIEVNYFVFKIIGLVSATAAKFNLKGWPVRAVADWDAREFNLSLDTSKTNNRLIFRLAESITTIVVHQKVKDAMESAGIDTLAFFVL